MRTMISILVFVLLPLAVLADDPDWLEAVDLKESKRPAELKDTKLSAQQLNVRGMAYYKKKQFKAAALLFHEAIRRDKKHVLAHYNLACTLSLLSDRLGPCGGFHPWDAFLHLKTSIELDPRRRAKARKDSDFSVPGMRDSLAFKLLTLDALKNPKQLREALAGTEYQIGSFNFTSALKLAPGGSATWVGSRPDPKHQGMDIPPAVAFEEKGSWSVEGRHLRLKNVGEKSGLYAVSYGGLKKVESPKDEPSGQTYDFPSMPTAECGH